MAVNHDTITPTSGTQTSSPVTLSVSLSSSGGYYIRSIVIERRKNGGSWSASSKSFASDCTAASHSLAVTIAHGDTLDWRYYYTCDVPALGLYGEPGSTSGPWSLPCADIAKPSIVSATPAASASVAPGSTGVVFTAAVTDNMGLDRVELWVEGLKEGTTSFAASITSGNASWALDLAKGSYDWYVKVYDKAGRSATLATRTVTVVNGLPAVPAGTITVAGETGAVSVANLGAIALSWPAFLDGNPEDTLAYTLENRAAGGAWAQVATGVTGLTYEWSPNIGLGAAELRVKANDGTADSAYLTRTGITIVSSQSPNEPTLTSPAGGESWREGETHNITWTEAGTEHPEGLPCVYEIQFSADGTFADAVTLTSDADDESYSWTLSTDLV